MTLVQTTTTTRAHSMRIPLPQEEPRVTIPAQNLRIPGPTPVPPAVLAELARPVMNHRGPEFAAILRRVTARLRELAPYRGLLLTHNETSTGVTNDLQTLAALIRRHNPDALIVLDAMSSLGCILLEMDAWDIDVAFTVSQKGLMRPPGLMMLAAGPRAWEANTQAKLPRFYFDWAKARTLLERGQHPVTPPVSLFYALDLALELLLAEGLEAVFARHQHLGEYVRKHVRAIGLHVLADPAHASNTVT